MLFQRKMLTMAMAGTLAACVGLNANAADHSFPSNVVSAYSQGSHADHLAGQHGKLGLDCTSCHPTAKVSDGEAEINANCTKCHGDLTAVAAKTEKAGEPNPHKSHLGTIQCTACHSGHEASVAYCTNCHDFPAMKKNFNKTAVNPSQVEDLKKYADAMPALTLKKPIFSSSVPVRRASLRQ